MMMKLGLRETGGGSIEIYTCGRLRAESFLFFLLPALLFSSSFPQLPTFQPKRESLKVDLALGHFFSVRLRPIYDSLYLYMMGLGSGNPETRRLARGLALAKNDVGWQRIEFQKNISRTASHQIIHLNRFELNPAYAGWVCESGT